MYLLIYPELKKKETLFAWSRNARRLHRDYIACNLYGKNFSTQHRVRDQTTLDY